MGEEGLKILAKVREETGLYIVTEAMDREQCDLVEEYADIIQIGARNMQNFPLLMAAGKIDRPVMLKRGISATIEEWLMAAEYIVSSGNPEVILCERGIRTFETYTRNTLDITAIPLLRELCRLPVIVDIRRREIEDWTSQGDYMADPEFKSRFQDWLSGLWEDKDKRFDEIRNERSPPLVGPPDA